MKCNIQGADVQTHETLSARKTNLPDPNSCGQDFLIFSSLILQPANMFFEDKTRKIKASSKQVPTHRLLTVVAAEAVLSERDHWARMPRTIAWRFTHELYRLHSLRSAR